MYMYMYMYIYLYVRFHKPILTVIGAPPSGRYTPPHIAADTVFESP